MKNLKALLVGGIAAATLLTSCKEDKKTEVTPGVTKKANEVYIYDNITVNTTWSKDSVYVLAGRIAVESGKELTIQAGTIIKGGSGSGANAKALIIPQGAKINAQGTAAEPIIFTSVKDQIEPGQMLSPNMVPTQSGLWGGLIVLGKAPISVSTNIQTASIEGIPATDLNGIYGGSETADNSGIISYVSIRHGGANIGEGNEINGLTLGGVGSGTTISYIEIVGNQDDGIEFFGGTVNASNVVVWNNGDDAIDTDQAWAGTLSNFVIINPGDEAFELDGPEGSYTSTGHTITNGTVFAMDGEGLVDFDDNSDVTISNIYFTDLKAGQDIEGYGPYTDNAGKSYNGYAANGVGYTASNFEATLASGVITDYFKGGSDAITTVVTTATTGATTASLKSWSWAGQASAKF